MSRRANAKLYLALAAATLAGGAGLLTMQWNAIGAEEARTTALRRERKDPAVVRAQLDASTVELTNVRRSLAHLEQGVPAQAYLPTMLKELEAAGRAQGIQVLGIRPVPPKTAPAKGEAKKPYRELDLEVKGRGRYGDVLRFVRALNTFPKVVATRAVTLDPKPDPMNPNAATVLEVTVMLRAYMFADGAKSEAGSAAGATARNEGVRIDG